MLKPGKALGALAVLASLTVSAWPAWAQQEGSHTGPKPAVTKIVGCLSHAAEDTIVLADEGGEETPVVGLADLKKHVGHKVRLTGKWVKQGKKKVFQTTKIEHLSANCN